MSLSEWETCARTILKYIKRDEERDRWVVAICGIFNDSVGPTKLCKLELYCIRFALDMIEFNHPRETSISVTPNLDYRD